MAEEAEAKASAPQGDAKARRKRLRKVVKRLYGMSIFLLAAAGVLSVLFLLSTEPKGTEHPRPVRVELPVEELSLDLRPFDRWTIKQEHAALMANTYVRDVVDPWFAGGEGVWIFDDKTPLGTQVSDFYVYIGETFDGVHGMLRIGCTSERPLHAPSVFISVDGVMYVIELEEFDWNDVEMPHVGGVHEYADVPLDQYDDVLRHVGYGRDVLVSFRSDAGAVSYRLTDSQVSAVAHMMRLLRVKQILYKDGVELRNESLKAAK